MPRITDQLGCTIELEHIPQRIVSLVPSQTELLSSLGLGNEVVGITKFCVHPPEWFRTKARVGGTKTVNIDKVLALKPDLVIANKEENIADQVMAIKEHYPVYTSDINDLNSAIEMIIQVGTLTARLPEAIELTSIITAKFALLQQFTIGKPTPRTAYLIWKDPWMAAGGDTFINDLLSRSGFNNMLADQPRYPEVSLGHLKSSGCDLLLLSSEPYPFSEKHLAELQHALPSTTIMLVDGEMFSWYGARLVTAADYFIRLVGLIHGKTVN